MERSLFPSQPILLIDDEEVFLRMTGLALAAEGLTNLVMCNDSRKALKMLNEQKFSIVALDINMPFISGMELLRMITKEYPEVGVVMITGMEDIKTAVECIRTGALDYIVKPVRREELALVFRKYLDYREYRNEASVLKDTVLNSDLQHPESFSEIITCSDKMMNIFRYAEAVSSTRLPVLVTGETGTGKELMARAVHKLSKRTGELVTVNVAGVDDNMFSDTLFGHRKGAFSGASTDRRGLIEEASDGTLFLDEIGDLSPESQVKLLRLLQDGSYYPLGSDVAKRSTARIVAATNRSLQQLRKESSFRKDLFYRLEPHSISLPPLRMRKSDLPLLVDAFIRQSAGELGKKAPTYPPELIPLLENYGFPGNVRELQGMIFDAVSLHKRGVLSLASFKSKIGDKVSELKQESSTFASDTQLVFPDPFPTLEQMETALFKEALKRAKGNKTLAAQMLGLTRQTL
ncbi:MAG: sigma-54-dependent transcriptional regulator, partial [Chitinispirillaceae bacterium]